MTRYTHGVRIALITGLISVGVLALAAAPAGATRVCPPGTTNPAYCSNVPPTAVTSTASAVGTNSATLNGVAGPGVSGGDITTYYFQYGTTTAYGKTTPSGTTATCPPGTTNPQYCTSNPATKSVSATITGLAPNTTYHFRIVATNSDGMTTGSDVTFKTKALIAPIKSVHVPKRVRHGKRFKVTVKLNERATLTIALLYHGHVVKRFNKGVRSGTVNQKIKAPHKKGRYTVRVKASANGVTETLSKTIKVT